MKNRRTEIIKTARHLFESKDYYSATMQDVMDSLGIAKGTIYHYFKSKEQLLEAVVEDIVEEHLKKMEAIIKKTKGNALKKLQKVVEAGRTASVHPGILDELHRRGNEAMHTRILAELLQKQAPLFAKVIQQGCDEGIFQTDYPLESAEFILSAIQFLTDPGIYPWTKKELARRVQAFPHIIEQLLNAPTGSFKWLFIK